MDAGVVLAIALLSGMLGFAIGIARREKPGRQLAENQTRQMALVGDVGEVVKVAGRVEFAGQTLQAPLTGRACAAYLSTVYRDTNNPEHGTAQELCVVPFYLVADDGHRAYVDTTACRLIVDSDSHTISSAISQPNQYEASFLARHNLSPQQDWLYREGVLEAGEEVAVIGLATRDLDPLPSRNPRGYRDAPQTMLVFRTSESTPLEISDSPQLIRNIREQADS